MLSWEDGKKGVDEPYVSVAAVLNITSKQLWRESWRKWRMIGGAQGE